MSKAILVVDMPENCADCQFGEIIEWGKIMCNIEHRSLPMVSYRPHWCSLIPEPERRKNGEAVGYKIGEPLTDELAERLIDFGYNECLDEIEIAVEDKHETN